MATEIQEGAEQSGERQAARRASNIRLGASRPGDHKTTKGVPIGLADTKRPRGRRLARKASRSQKKRKAPFLIFSRANELRVTRIAGLPRTSNSLESDGRFEGPEQQGRRQMARKALYGCLSNIVGAQVSNGVGARAPTKRRKATSLDIRSGELEANTANSMRQTLGKSLRHVAQPQPKGVLT